MSRSTSVHHYAAGSRSTHNHFYFAPSLPQHRHRHRSPSPTRLHPPSPLRSPRALWGQRQRPFLAGPEGGRPGRAMQRAIEDGGEAATESVKDARDGNSGAQQEEQQVKKKQQRGEEHERREQHGGTPVSSAPPAVHLLHDRTYTHLEERSPCRYADDGRDPRSFGEGREAWCWDVTAWPPPWFIAAQERGEREGPAGGVGGGHHDRERTTNYSRAWAAHESMWCEWINLTPSHYSSPLFPNPSHSTNNSGSENSNRHPRRPQAAYGKALMRARNPGSHVRGDSDDESDSVPHATIPFRSPRDAVVLDGVLYPRPASPLGVRGRDEWYRSAARVAAGKHAARLRAQAETREGREEKEYIRLRGEKKAWVKKAKAKAEREMKVRGAGEGRRARGEVDDVEWRDVGVWCWGEGWMWERRVRVL